MFQNATKKDLKFSEIKDKVLCVANHRAHMVTPQPMDIGNVSQEWDLGGGDEGWQDCVEGGAGDIMAMGKGGWSQCLRCGGYGHFARECGTPVGKGDFGKGDFGKGTLS